MLIDCFEEQFLNSQWVGGNNGPYQMIGLKTEAVSFFSTDSSEQKGLTSRQWNKEDILESFSLGL